MVSSEGPTPSKGEGPIAHGSGFGDESDSDRSGATVRSDQPIPRVLISSSGGASTSVGAEPVDGDPQSGTNGPGDGRCGRAPTTAPPTSAPAPPAIAVAVTAALATASVPFAVATEPAAPVGKAERATSGRAVPLTIARLRDDALFASVPSVRR